MPAPAFDTLDAARRLTIAGMESEQAEAIVEVMAQSVDQLVTRDTFDAGIAKLGMELHARIDGVESSLQSLGAELHARIDGVESKVQSLETTVRTEIMRAVLIVVGVLIPAIGLMLAIGEYYSARGGGLFQ